MSDQLADGSARATVETDLDTTLIVEAGAGTGKTEALVRRVIALIASGKAAIDQIAAITFTTAAAAELRTRVRNKIEECLDPRMSADLAGRLGLSKKMVTENLEAGLAGVDGATIVTIHSFARSILTGFPLQAGLPPGFQVADEIEASINFGERWSAFLDELFDSSDTLPVLRAALLLGLSTENLRRLAASFHENWDRLAEIEVPRALPQVDPGRLIASLDRLVEMSERCEDESDLLYERIIAVIPIRDDLKAARGDDLVDLIVLEQSRNTVSAAGKGRASSWGGAASKAEVVAVFEEAKNLLAEILDPLRQAVLATLVALTNKFTLDGVRHRRVEGRLEFHDLLVHTRNLLRGNLDVRTQLRNQYTHILVDEFQDTDPLQAEICALLATPAEAIAIGTKWYELPADDGRVFFVGDPKQSIYRFRRADIATYIRAKKSFGGGPKSVNLTVNFRSHNSIINWVNEVFTRIMTAGEGQPDYVALDPSRTGEHPDGDSRVFVTGEPTDLPAHERRHLEAKSVAAAISKIRDEQWTVDTRDSSEPDGVGQGRSFAYKDIAILVRGRTSIDSLEAALEAAGIPYRVEARSLILDSQEVRDLLSVLAAVADPSDDIAVVAALKSAAFGCSDKDLIDYYMSSGRKHNAWHPSSTTLEESSPIEPVIAALRSLNDFRETLWWRGPTGLIEHIVTSTRLLHKATWARSYRESWRRIRYVTDQCRAFVAAGGGGVNEFLDWIRRQAAEQGSSGETLLADPDEDAVRITTIHASKGLQYPIVIVAGIGNQKGRGESPSAIWGADGSAEFSLGRKDLNLRTPGYQAFKEIESEMERLEAIRLLYVALTRAEDHLIVSLHHKPGSPPSGAQVIWEAVESAGLSHRRLDEEYEPSRSIATEISPANLTPPKPDSPKAQAARAAGEAWRLKRQEKISLARHTPIVAATAVAGLMPGLPELAGSSPDSPTEDLTTPQRRGRAGTAIGRAVHAVLEVIDLQTPRGLSELCREQAAVEHVSDSAAEIEELVTSVLKSPSVRDATGSLGYWREVFVGSMLSSSLGIEGYIDLLYRTESGLVIVDYKTDRARTDPEIDERMEKYKYQGAAYAIAAGRATGEEISEVVFVFARPKGAIERRVTDLKNLGEEIP